VLGEELGIQVEELRLAVGVVLLVAGVLSAVVEGVRVRLVHALHDRTVMRLRHDCSRFTQEDGRMRCPTRKMSPP
jgi:hypothetical protein